jgi:hypothetical protein
LITDGGRTGLVVGDFEDFRPAPLCLEVFSCLIRATDDKHVTGEQEHRSMPAADPRRVFGWGSFAGRGVVAFGRPLAVRITEAILTQLRVSATAYEDTGGLPVAEVR